MPKQRVHDPKTGKIAWREVGATPSPTTTTPPAPATSPAKPSKPRAQRGRTATAPTKPPRAKRSEWDTLFDGAQDSDDANAES